MFPAVDISKYQGAWQDYPADIVIIKMSGGDAGLYFDPDAATNYTDAKAAGKHVGGYHFVGWTEGAAAEASWFIKAMSPLAENDVFALDAESGAVAVSASSPAYILAMAEYIHNAIGVWPLVYMSLSTLNAYDWSAVLANCGLWLADWNNNPSGTVPTSATYIMQQYSDGPVYDHDEFFGPSLAAFDEYGYKTPLPATPTPSVANPPAQDAPVTIPVQTPAPEAPTQPTIVAPTVTPTTAPVKTGTVMDVTPPKPSTVIKPSNVTHYDTEIEKVAGLVWSKYNKFFIATAGSVITFLLQRYGSAPITKDIVLVLTALGVWGVPNA